MTVAALISATVLGLATEASATFPGSNGRIAYLRMPWDRSSWSPAPPRGIEVKFSVRSVRPDGSGDARLLGAAHTDIVEWSPDGSAFAGSTSRGPDDHIFLADAATGERSTVVLVADIPGAHFVRSLAFSPDGGALVVCVSVEPGEVSTRLYTMGLGGEDLTMVSDRPDCYADWSVTNRIVATSGTYRLARKIVTMNPDGSARQVAVSNPTRGFGEAASVAPSWAPDGSLIVYSAWARRKQQDLYVVEGDGNGWARMTRTPRRAEYAPLFSPDGNMIVFTRGSGRRFKPFLPADLFLMDADGTGPRRLTDTPGRSEFTLSWRAR